MTPFWRQYAAADDGREGVRPMEEAVSGRPRAVDWVLGAVETEAAGASCVLNRSPSMSTD